MAVLSTLSRKRISHKSLFKLLLVFLSSLLLLSTTSCGSSKPKVVTTKREAAKINKSSRNATKPVYTASETPIKNETVSVDERNESSSTLIDATIENAMSYEGTRYKYGGTTSKGMDCSGLIFTSFKEAGKSVPRTSASLFNAAASVNFTEVQKGDLLFFATGKNKSRVNHVGLVVNITPAEVQFIHASSSRGVMISSMNEAYWLNAYLSAGRLE